jgi:hypothetical protein
VVTGRHNETFEGVSAYSGRLFHDDFKYAKRSRVSHSNVHADKILAELKRVTLHDVLGFERLLCSVFYTPAFCFYLLL